MNIRRRIEALEAATNPVPPLALVFVFSHSPSPVRTPTLRAFVHCREMVQGDDESEDAFHARLRVAAARPGQAVVVLDERDMEL